MVANVCELKLTDKEGCMNSPLEYILVGIVTVGVLVYLVIALLAPEKF
jgi:K+-transporting ATPase KdpF subunit